MFYNYRKNLLKSKIWMLSWLAMATIVGLIFLSQTAQAQSFRRGGGGGINWRLAFDYNLRLSNIKISNETKSESIIVSPLNHVFKIKFGGALAKYNFFYGSLAITEAGSKDKKITKFKEAENPSGQNTTLRQAYEKADIQGHYSGYELGLGYSLLLGPYKRNTFNFYGGLETSIMFFTSAYFPNEAPNTQNDQHKIFRNKTTSIHFIPSLQFHLGFNYLVGAIDYHFELIYSLNQSSKKNLSVLSNDKYNENVNILGISLVLGIMNYF